MKGLSEDEPSQYNVQYFEQLVVKGTHTGLDRRAYFSPWLRRLVKRLCATTVVDLGCGDGFYLRQMPANVKIFGFDVSRAGLLNHAGSGSRIPVVQADVLELPIRSSIADLVLLLDVVEHVRQDYQLLGEVKRILKPYGYLLMSTPNGSSFGHSNKGEDWFAYRDSTHCNIRNFDYWVELLRRNNFRLTRVGSDSCWDTPYNLRIPHQVQWLLGVTFAAATRVMVGFWPWTKGENFYAIAQVGS